MGRICLPAPACNTAPGTHRWLCGSEAKMQSRYRLRRGTQIDSSIHTSSTTTSSIILKYTLSFRHSAFRRRAGVRGGKSQGSPAGYHRVDLRVDTEYPLDGE
jgi:hypothetical protein